MNKLAMKLATSVVAFAAMFVVAIPVFAVQIDYEKEQIEGIANTQEYSWDRKKWSGVYDASTSKIDISTLIKTTGSVNLYYRDKDTVDADITTLTIPARPATPSSVKFMPKATTSLDIINTTDSHEVKYGYSTWVLSPLEGTSVGLFEKKGAVLSVRAKAVAGSSFASAEAKINVPKQRAKPATAKYDIKTDGVVVAKGMEYQIGTRPASGTASLLKDDAWKTVDNTQKLVLRSEINSGLKDLVANDGDQAYVYVRLKSSATLAASEYSSVKVPASIIAPTTPTLNITDEKIKTASTLMEYRVLNDKAALTATYSTPKWTALTGSEQSITKLISPATSKTPNTLVQVRLKAVPGSGNVADKPASAAKEFKIAKRPVTPKLTDITMNYDPSVLTMSVPSTHQWMYDTDTRWTDGGTDVSIKAKVPAKGGKPAKVFVRVKPIEVSGADDIDVPASVVFKGGLINATPAAPASPTFNKATKKITGVTTKMEYIIDSGMSWETVAGTSIDLSGYPADATGTVKVRLKSTATKPVSEEKLVAYTIPSAK